MEKKSIYQAPQAEVFEMKMDSELLTVSGTPEEPGVETPGTGPEQ